MNEYTALVILGLALWVSSPPKEIKALLAKILSILTRVFGSD